jgi:hypothetical protein
MRELIGKIGRLCENHVEKIVLAIAGIISAWLFVSGVLFTRDVVQYGGKSVPVTRIDFEISQKLENLRAGLKRAESKTEEGTYVSRLTGPVGPNDPVFKDVLGSRPQPNSLQELFRSPLAFLSASGKTSIQTTAPTPVAAAPVVSGPKYRLPSIPRLKDTAVQYLRAAAYVPVADVTQEKVYSGGQSEVDDIDLVTVEARLDIADIYKQFRESFGGSGIPADWRDPCLASPKFAALQLQRQEVLDTGLWSEWTTVPPTRVCPYRNLFDGVENVKDLPVGGIALRMAKYDSLSVAASILQADPYQIASADERWYPPSFYDKFKRIQRQVEMAEKNKERQDAQNQTATAGGATTAGGRRETTGRGGATGAQGGRATTGGRGSMTGGGDMYGGAGGGLATGRGRGTTGGRGATGDAQAGRAGATGRGATGARTGRGVNDTPNPQDPTGRGLQDQGPSLADVEVDFRKNQIVVPGMGQGTGTNLATLTDPILVWAIDDTAQPGKTYRYRMRVGVLNPVAGTGHVAERDAARKDQVVLWSDFAPVAEPVSVYKKVYFFAKDVQEQTRTASIEVARYLRGYWRSETFQVRPGETIGKEVGAKKERKKPATDASARITAQGRRDDPTGIGMIGNNLGLGVGQTTDDLNPTSIDYSTDALLVDVVPVRDWSGSNARPRDYFDVLYTEDGSRIEHMPANSQYWSKSLADAREQINGNLRKDRKEFRAFGVTGRSTLDRGR